MSIAFGRKPAKHGDSGRSFRPGTPAAPLAHGGSSGESESFRRIKEEMAEREQWARDAADVAEEESRPRSKGEAAPSRRRGPNPRVFFQVEVRGKLNGKLEASGRLEFELFADSVPKTAENVRCLSTGEKGSSLHYENSKFHRIVPGLFAQGGDITFGDGGGGDGSGTGSGRSIYGDTFADEGFHHPLKGRGTLAMASTGPDTNNSQFIILLASEPLLKEKHVVVGKMTKEQNSILDRIEDCGTKSGRVASMVSIVECGEIGGNPHVALKSRSRSRNRDSGKGGGKKGRRHGGHF